MRETGSVETRVSKRGRKPALSQTEIQNIDQLIKAQSDITIHEIQGKRGTNVCQEKNKDTVDYHTTMRHSKQVLSVWSLSKSVQAVKWLKNLESV